MNSNKLLSLNNLPINQLGEVKYIKDNHLKRRFLDLGVIPGTIIKTERYSPSGNPIAFNIRGTILAIRNDESSNIIVKKI